MYAERTIGEGQLAPILISFAAIVVIGFILILPLAVVFNEALAPGVTALLAGLADPDAVAAIKLSLLVAGIVVPLNTLFGVAAAWLLTRHHFWGRRVLLTLIALPFSVSPVVAGLVYVLLFGSSGWFAPVLSPWGIRVLFATPALVLATLFVTLPFVASQLIPLMAAQGTNEEEAGLTLGASGWQVLRLITLPRVKWALLQGVLLCTARALGEFGAVSVVSGHIRGLTNTIPLQIEILYNQYDIAAAFGLAAVLALMAVATMAGKALLEWQQARIQERGEAAVLEPGMDTGVGVARA